MKIEIHQEVEIPRTHRVEMLESMFEIPTKEKLAVSLSGELPIEGKYWNVGLIVGPSGSGKTLTLKKVFGEPTLLEWKASSVIDDFSSELSMESISRVCQSVGFNTIPSWMRPFNVLSNGEKFRVEIARRLVECGQSILMDEFTSVVDRVVARTTSFAIGKYVRENNKQFIAASCHYDIIDWLQPDWILEPGNPCKFSWRSLQGRPPITVSVSRVKYETWNLFRDFHYMSQDLNKAARCYGLYVSSLSNSNETVGTMPELLKDMGKGNKIWRNGDIQLSENVSTNRIASMCGVLHRPHPKVSDICGFTRMVTLPDFQGLGLAFVLANTVASAYKAMGKRLHSYPNHPAWIRSYQRSKDWVQIKSSGQFSPQRGKSSTVGGFGGRRCAVFMYIGTAMKSEDARRLINGD